MRSTSRNFYRAFRVSLIFLVAACSLEKKSGFNRTMQNLTAHYNILFNANEILKQKQDSYALSFIDSYNNFLNVYQDTTAQTGTPDKDLELAIEKANKIINIKEQSNYIGDAYLVLGKANYLEANYFNAAEYFSYVIKSFPKQTQLVQEARVWHARSLMYLRRLPEAKLVLDTAFLNLNPKKSITADVYATKLQYDINAGDYVDGEEMAKKAIHYSNTSKQELRWTFIIAQLQEVNKKPTDAYNNYSKIVKSNAAFEMAFNANLDRIRIADNQNGQTGNRIEQLRALLKNENNKEFKDQIYYQIGEQYMANNNIDKAMDNYKLSVRNSQKNQTQKGLSYLRLADSYFKYKTDYVAAKKYYDSTLTSLPPGYPGYQVIQKKNNNLALLADRLQIVAKEDTLQALAKLDERTRMARIDQIAKQEAAQKKAAAASASTELSSDPFSNPDAGPQVSTTAASNFYFYNANAVSQGIVDFKRKWGNRKLEDNWRRGSRQSSNITVNNTAVLPTTSQEAITNNLTKTTEDVEVNNFRQELLQNLPLTPDLLNRSNNRVFNALMDIGNFYRDVMNDKKEAIETYETMLKRFPDNPDKAPLYYNLYRLHSGDGSNIDELYKKFLLRDYPRSAFARAITEPEFAPRMDDENSDLNAGYDRIYTNYSGRNYSKVIAQADSVLKQQPNNKFSSQLSYLRAIAKGHQEKLPPFREELTKIVEKYPDDKLITPLVKQHLAYIDSHKAEMSKRRFAIMDTDPNEVPFTPPVVGKQAQSAAFALNRPYTAPSKGPISNAVTPSKTTAKPETPVKPPAAIAAAPTQPKQNQVGIDKISNQPKQNQVGIDKVANQPKQNQAGIDAKKEVSIFSKRDSANYYFAVNVSSGTTNLASTRFGFGQFNRANYSDNSINHQLLFVGDDNQIIYIGRFYSLAAVKAYARAIVPLLPEIMKVPKEKYSFFIITKENLDKLADKNLLDRYVDYYQKNY